MNGINAFSKAISDVLKAGKNLGLVMKGAKGESGSLLVAGDRTKFPEKLWDLAEALSKIPKDSYESHHVMPVAMAEAMVAWATSHGLSPEEPRAIADWFLEGKTPSYNKKALMKIIGEQEQRVRELGHVAPRIPVIRARQKTVQSSPERKLSGSNR